MRTVFSFISGIISARVENEFMLKIFEERGRFES